MYVELKLGMKVVMFRHCSQPVEKFGLESGFTNQEADMDLQEVEEEEE